MDSDGPPSPPDNIVKFPKDNEPTTARLYDQLTPAERETLVTAMRLLAKLSLLPRPVIDYVFRALDYFHTLEPELRLRALAAAREAIARDQARAPTHGGVGPEKVDSGDTPDGKEPK